MKTQFLCDALTMVIWSRRADLKSLTTSFLIGNHENDRPAELCYQAGGWPILCSSDFRLLEYELV